MKKSKLLMLGTAVALTMSSFSLSAIPTPDEIVTAVRNSRACPAAPEIEQEPTEQGWFSAFRQSAGNAFRSIGDSLRTEGDKSTAAGKCKEFVKDGFFAVASAKIGLSLDSVKGAICNSVGNGLRTVGQWIKGGEATQTTTRVILDQMGPAKYSSDNDVKYALRTIAEATLKLDEATALKEYDLVSKGLVKRAYASDDQLKEMDINGIYFKALAEKELREDSNMTYATFATAVKSKGLDALENVNAVKNASIAQKLQVMDQYIKDVYEKIKSNQ